MDVDHINLRYTPCKSLGGPIMKVSTLLGVREILCVGDLELSILLNKSEDAEGVVVELITIDSVEYDCELCWWLDVII